VDEREQLFEKCCQDEIQSKLEQDKKEGRDKLSKGSQLNWNFLLGFVGFLYIMIA
jgi:hypothetical protein